MKFVEGVSRFAVIVFVLLVGAVVLSGCGNNSSTEKSANMGDKPPLTVNEVFNVDGDDVVPAAVVRVVTDGESKAISVPYERCELADNGYKCYTYPIDEAGSLSVTSSSDTLVDSVVVTTVLADDVKDNDTYGTILLLLALTIAALNVVVILLNLVDDILLDCGF